jgi:hypothetical protein
MQYEIRTLPAVLLLSSNGGRELAKLCGEQELSSVFRGGLPDFIRSQAKSLEFSRSEDKAQQAFAQLRRQNLPALAEASAEWVKAAGVRLLIWNAEGTLKKPCNVSMPPRPGATFDSFNHWGTRYMPLLKALLLAQDTKPGETPRLSNAAPFLCMVSDLGHQTRIKKCDRDEPKMGESKVREVMHKLLIRICNELGLGPEDAQLFRSRTKVYHSFLPPSFKQLEGKGPEWSPKWCLPQPGQMTQALRDYERHGASRDNTLVVGTGDRDSDAAMAAGIYYINHRHLAQGAPADHLQDPSRAHSHRSRGVAPAAFAMG